MQKALCDYWKRRDIFTKSLLEKGATALITDFQCENNILDYSGKHK